jgi:hypothetical protein
MGAGHSAAAHIVLDRAALLPGEALSGVLVFNTSKPVSYHSVTLQARPAGSLWPRAGPLAMRGAAHAAPPPRRRAVRCRGPPETQPRRRPAGLGPGEDALGGPPQQRRRQPGHDNKLRREGDHNQGGWVRERGQGSWMWLQRPC